MSYWTYTDLFEEPGPPTAPFQGGFGLLNPQGIRKPAYFAYKYLHALQGLSLIHIYRDQLAVMGPGGQFLKPGGQGQRCV